MDVRTRNDLLARGRLEARGLFPHLEGLAKAPAVFRMDFGLDVLPAEPGVLLIRGARQYGKSTWLESRLRSTVEEFGPATAFYLNGDELPDANRLVVAVRGLLGMFRRDAAVRRLFIDEITAVPDWERGLKRLLDEGELSSVLVVTTGSKAADLRRGSERLPGRKGRLGRSSYVFTPVSFGEFRRVAAGRSEKDLLAAYLLSGGSPVACAELATSGTMPPYVTEIVRDWVLGECSRSGRTRASMLAVLRVILAHGASPLGQARLARDAGLANNTVAAGYVELLADLMCVGICQAFDHLRRVPLMRKPAKYPVTNLLAAVALDPAQPRSPAELLALPSSGRGRWWEWLVAQELWRRAARRGMDSPELMSYWSSREHELDYVVAPDLFLEVKHGTASPMEFSWFPQTFPKARLVVINRKTFSAGPITGITMEQFLGAPDADF